MKMKRVGKNSIAVGLTTLLVSVALSFSAQGADNFESHAEARYLMGEGPVGTVVEGLGGALESNGAQACEPDDGTCDGQAFVEGPLDPLKQVTVPMGDAANLRLGVVNDYAEAGHTTPGVSKAVTGAVSNDGIVTTGPDSPPADATLDLSGSALGELDDALGNVKLDLGAISSSAQLGQADSTLVRDYGIADGELTLKVNALEDFNTAIGGVVSKSLADPATLNGKSTCSLLNSLGKGLTVDSPVSGQADLDCGDVAALDGVLTGKITGLSSVTGGLTSVTQDGVRFDFTTGEITVDLEKAIFAATGSHLNGLDPSTHLLEKVLPELVLNLSPALDKVRTQLVDKILNDAVLEPKVLGADVPGSPFALKSLGEAGLDGPLGSVFDGLTTGLDAIAEPLAPALKEIATGLKPILDVIVNVPDLYTTKGIVSDKAPGQVSTSAAEDDKFFSQTALQVVVADGELADLRIGNAQVVPVGANGSADGNDRDSDNGNGNDNGNDRDSDNDNGNDNDRGHDAQADADNDRDADAAADADVTSTLPDTGAPNVLPLLLLALGLIGFGSAVLVNERRRLNKV